MKAQGLSILHSPVNIANDPWSISRAERDLGCRSDVASVALSPYVERPDFDLTFPRSGPLRRQLKKAGFVRRALREYDVFRFDFASSVLDYGEGPFSLLDLKAASHRHKTVAMTFHGCDVRPVVPRLCGACPVGCDPARAVRRLDICRRHCSRLYVKTPDLLKAVPEGSYVPQGVWRPEAVKPVPPRRSGPLRVVHAPSDRRTKGSSSVVQACEQLVAQGAPIELVMVENMSRAEAQQVYTTADIAVDQLLIGWYGVFAIEMMLLGKPVICRIEKEYLDLSGLPSLPIISASRETLANVLSSLVDSPSSLPEIGSAGRDFALSHHDAGAIAKRLLLDCEQGTARGGGV